MVNKLIPVKHLFAKIKEHYGNTLFKMNDIESFLEQEFGDLAQKRFENCQGTLFTFSQIMYIFVTKGKLLKVGESFQINKDFTCK